MVSLGNKYSLADQAWEKADDGYIVKSIFKMIPAIHAFNPVQKYLITLNNGVKYTGVFQHYLYKKETPDSPLIRVFVELKIDEGIILLSEDSIQGYVKMQ
jgi:hypothetical protein